MYTRDSAILSRYINRIITDQGSTLGSFFKPTFSEYVQKLFSNGEQGFFYDPNVLSTMFQDAAGTVPVTAVGQPVGLIRDKSGRNNHARQTNSASRPILRKNAVTGANYLEFDGTDDFLQTNNIDFTGTDKVSLFTGVRKLSDVAAGCLVETGAGGNSGTISVFAPISAAGNYFFRVYGASGNDSLTATTFNAPITNVLSCSFDNSLEGALNTVKPRIDGSTPSLSVMFDTSTTSNYGNYPLYIGRRGGTTLPFNGHIYSLIGVGKLVSDTETVAIEKELAKRTGVTLNV